jgi:hypothetical protein
VPSPIFDESTTLTTPRPATDWRQVRDLLGLLLVLVGGVGLVVTAWLWNPLAGAAALSVACIAGGLALGYDW